MWILDYLEDLKADFRAVFHVPNIYELDGPTFFSLAFRVAAYQGVIYWRIRAEREEEDGGEEISSYDFASATPSAGRQISDSQMLGDPAFAGIFDYEKEGG